MPSQGAKRMRKKSRRTRKKSSEVYLLP
jgi:hypothetical protein